MEVTVVQSQEAVDTSILAALRYGDRGPALDRQSPSRTAPARDDRNDSRSRHLGAESPPDRAVAFFVLAGDARNELGRFMGNQNAERYPEGDPNREIERARGAKKALRAPVVIGVAVEPVRRRMSTTSKRSKRSPAPCKTCCSPPTRSDLALVGSGNITKSPEVNAWFGLSERGQVLGFIYIGYPAMVSERSVRTPSAGLTEWRGWDETQG